MPPQRQPTRSEEKCPSGRGAQRQEWLRRTVHNDFANPSGPSTSDGRRAIARPWRSRPVMA